METAGETPMTDSARSQPFHHRVLRHPGTHIALAAAILAADFVTGREGQFPVYFVLPVLLAGWYCQPAYAYALAVLQPLARFGFNYLWSAPFRVEESEYNFLIRVSLLLLIAYLVTRTARQARELAEEVRTLQGILPICSFCKRIRDEREEWQPLEAYVSRHSGTRFTHSFCPDCRRQHYGEPGGRHGRPG